MRIKSGLACLLVSVLGFWIGLENSSSTFFEDQNFVMAYLCFFAFLYLVAIVLLTEPMLRWIRRKLKRSSSSERWPPK